MFGFSRTIRHGKTVEYEFVQIREVEPGKLAYLAQPSGQPSATEFVFENLAHDFPMKRISCDAP